MAGGHGRGGGGDKPGRRNGAALETGSGTAATYLLAGDDSAPETAAVLAVVGVVVCPCLAGHAIQSEQLLWDGKDLVTGQDIGGADVMRPDAGFVLASLAQLALLVTVLLAPARRPGRGRPGT